MKNLWKEYNQSLPPVPPGVKALQEKMIKESGWVKGDGDYPGHFFKRGCIWSVVWQVAEGTIYPRQFWPLNCMPAEPAILEMLDYAERELRPGQNRNRASHLLKLVLELRKVENGKLDPDQFMRFLKANLKGYHPEYTWVHSPPDLDRKEYLNRTLIRYRPGWPKE